MTNRKPIPPPPGRLEDIHARFEAQKRAKGQPAAAKSEAPTWPPPRKEESGPPPRTTHSGIRPRRTKTIAATVDEVVADMSKDPRRDDDE